MHRNREQETLRESILGTEKDLDCLETFFRHDMRISKTESNSSEKDILYLSSVLRFNVNGGI